MRILPHAHSHCNRLLHNHFARIFCTCTLGRRLRHDAGDRAPRRAPLAAAGRERIAPAGRRSCAAGRHGVPGPVFPRGPQTYGPMNCAADGGNVMNIG
jgi:hypothetical protein